MVEVRVARIEADMLHWEVDSSLVVATAAESVASFSALSRWILRD